MTTTEQTAAPASPEAPPAAAVEAAAPVEVQPPEPPPAARDWNALRAQEARLRKQAESLKADRAAAEEARAYRAEIEKLAKESPEEALKRLGLSYDEITKRRLQGGRKDPAEAVKEAARAEAERLFREQRESEQKAAEERQQAAQAEQWTRVVSAFEAHVNGSGESHELLRSELADSPEEVQAVLRGMAARQPDLSIERAADLYEGWLVEQTKKRMSLGKIKALLQPAAPAETDTAAQSTTGRDAGAHGARTLTNSHAQERASTSSEPRVGSRQKSERDEHEAAIRRAMARIG